MPIVDLDLGLILWFWAEMLSSVIGWPVNSWPWLWIDFKISSWNIEEKLLALTLNRFYDFKLKCWQKLKMFTVLKFLQIFRMVVLSTAPRLKGCSTVIYPTNLTRSWNLVCRFSKDLRCTFWQFRLFSLVAPSHSLKNVSF